MSFSEQLRGLKGEELIHFGNSHPMDLLLAMRESDALREAYKRASKKDFAFFRKQTKWVKELLKKTNGVPGASKVLVFERSNHAGIVPIHFRDLNKNAHIVGVTPRINENVLISEAHTYAHFLIGDQRTVDYQRLNTQLGGPPDFFMYRHPIFDSGLEGLQAVRDLAQLIGEFKEQNPMMQGVVTVFDQVEASYMMGQLEKFRVSTNLTEFNKGMKFESRGRNFHYDRFGVQF